jgi:DNA-directed RNA polymerase specialized sigma24 family protein
VHNKNKSAKATTSQRPDIVQWYNKETDRYVKFERATGEVLAEKVTAGPYKNIHVAKRRPHKRKPKPATKPTLLKKEKPKKKVAKKAAKPKKPRKVNYLNNKDLMLQVALSKEQGQMTDRLAHMLQTLAARYGRKGNFANYTYNDDMQAYAMMMLVRTWNRFDPAKSNNPFAFFTQCIKNSFIQFLNQERRQRDIRDVMLVDNGLDPSYTFQEAHAAKRDEERKNAAVLSDEVDGEGQEQDARDSGE